MIQLALAWLALLVEGSRGYTSFCATPARCKKALVTAKVVNRPNASDLTSSSDGVCVMATVSGESRLLGIAVTSRGRSDGTSGIGGSRLRVESRYCCAVFAICCQVGSTTVVVVAILIIRRQRSMEL